MGVEDIRTGINGTGVTGLVRGTADGPGKDRVVLIRADMDALPILEENDVEYRSQTDGVMHACGHDAHTAILLGVARTLMGRRDQFAGTVKLLFQPARGDAPGGAIGMIDGGRAGRPPRGCLLRIAHGAGSAVRHRDRCPRADPGRTGRVPDHDPGQGWTCRRTAPGDRPSR